MNNIYVFHHNDHDGIVAAGILYNKFSEERRDKIIFNMIDYDKDLNFDMIDLEGNDQVYFLDYSFSSDHNKTEFEKLLQRRTTANGVIWIDHHLSSLGIFKDYKISGIRNTALSGAAWTYLYLYCQKSLKELYHPIINDKEKVSDIFHSDSDIPVFLKFIDDYDCWKHIYAISNDFHYGLTISNPKDEIISDLLSGCDDVYDIILSGEKIQKYLDFENKEYHVNMYGFEYTLPKEHGGIKCFCLNRKGNSIMFGDKINEYDAVIPFYYINGIWKYSIFTNKSDVDCLTIAKSYGGGGHKMAAGFQTDKLIFEDK